MFKYLFLLILLVSPMLSMADKIQPPPNSCDIVGTVNAVLYSDWCYDYKKQYNVKCSDVKVMTDRSDPFDPTKYHVGHQTYFYHPNGLITSRMIPFISGQVTAICLNSFEPQNPTAARFIGLNSHYPGTFSTYGSTNITDPTITIVVMPVVNARASRWSDFAYFCKHDSSYNVTVEDFCDASLHAAAKH